MEISRSVLVPYSADAMFDLIEQAEWYPSFLPWCTAAEILERSEDWVAARIEFSYLNLRFAMSTRNPKRRPEWLQVRLVEGPFRQFHGDWRLVPLADQLDLGVFVNVPRGGLGRDPPCVATRTGRADDTPRLHRECSRLCGLLHPG